MRDLKKQRLKELRLIEKKNGGLIQPEDVVIFARNEKTALHSVFEWDNTKAAEQYRICQARHLLRVLVTVEEVNNEEVKVSAFVSLRNDRIKGGDHGYRYMPVVMLTEEGRASVLDTALAELESFKVKYKMLKELASVFDAIESVSHRK